MDIDEEKFDVKPNNFTLDFLFNYQFILVGDKITITAPTTLFILTTSIIIYFKNTCSICLKIEKMIPRIAPHNLVSNPTLSVIGSLVTPSLYLSTIQLISNILVVI